MTENEVRTFRVEPELNEYLRHNVPNVSKFINETVWDAVSEGYPDGPEYESGRVRARILRMHLEVLEKEIFELERQRDAIRNVLMEMDDEPKAVWQIRLDTVVQDRHRGRPARKVKRKDILKEKEELLDEDEEGED